MLGTVLDGIPESAVLGMPLVGGGGVSVSLLAGIWISNFPESLSSSVGMQTTWAKNRIRLMWLGIVAVPRSRRRSDTEWWRTAAS